MGLRCVIALICLFGASGSRLVLQQKHKLRARDHKTSITSDLAALERFANLHHGRHSDLNQLEEEITSDNAASDLLANVTDQADKSTEGAITAHGIFIPHGKNVPQQPGQKYMVATTSMECDLCERLIQNGNDFGTGFALYSQRIIPEFMQMAKAMTKVLQSCPEFTNGWCYQDLGGSQKLRGPCPDHLICHYCLGLNPLMCID